MLTNQLPPGRPRLKSLLQIAAVVAGLLGIGGTGVFITSAPPAKACSTEAVRDDRPRILVSDRRTAETSGPAIAGKTSAAPYTLVRLKATGVPKGAGLVWRVSPRVGVDRATTKSDLLEFTAPPGTYEVELLVIEQGADGITTREVFERVTIGDPKVTPPPPNPGAGKLDPVQALGRIQFGNGSCTATVIGPRRADGRWDVLTASHCVSGVGAKGTLHTKAGKVLPVRVVVHQARPDLAWMVTVDPVEDLAYANVAADLPAVGVKMFHQGYGMHVPGNREDGTVLTSEDGNGQSRFWLSVSPGDSGGGMLRSDNLEVISTVCCTNRLSGLGEVWGASVRSIRAARPGAVKLDSLPEPANDDGSPCGLPLLLDAFGRWGGR